MKAFAAALLAIAVNARHSQKTTEEVDYTKDYTDCTNFFDTQVCMADNKNLITRNVKWVDYYKCMDEICLANTQAQTSEIVANLLLMLSSDDVEIDYRSCTAPSDKTDCMAKNKNAVTRNVIWPDYNSCMAEICDANGGIVEPEPTPKVVDPSEDPSDDPNNSDSGAAALASGFAAIATLAVALL